MNQLNYSSRPHTSSCVSHGKANDPPAAIAPWTLVCDSAMCFRCSRLT